MACSAPRGHCWRRRTLGSSLAGRLGTLALVAGTLGACDREGSGERGASSGALRSPFDPDRPESPTPAAVPQTLGEWAEATDYRMRVVRLQTCEVEPYFAPLEGHDKLGVFVEIEGRNSPEVPVNVLHGHLTDDQGRSYSPTPAGCRPTLPAGRVTEGKSSRGFISFEVPRDSKSLVLEYDPLIVGRARQPLRFALSR